MKKILIPIACLITALSFSQENEKEQNGTETDAIAATRKHELRIDAIEAIASEKIEINYEYVFSKYSGIGGYVSYDFDQNDYVEDQVFAIGGFYRQYFFNRKDFGARGLYAEGLMQYGYFEDKEFRFDFDTQRELEDDLQYSAFGIGFALGQKWVSSNGFILEISAGVGRNFGNQDYRETDVFFRGGILVGYRFL